jgi:hypothetical protein
MAINRELSQFGRLVTINDNEHIGIGTTSNISIGFGTITATSITASSFIGDGSGLTNLPTGSGGGGGTSSQWTTDATGITTTSNVGIKSTAPTSTLDVDGDVKVSGIITASNLLPSTDNTGVVGNATLTWSNGQFTNLTIDSTLNVRAAIDLADSDILRFGTSDDVQIFYDGTANDLEIELEAAATKIAITDNGTYKHIITKDGKIGINTSVSPTSALDVTGDVKVSGIVTATDFNSSSDINLKTNIQTIENPIDKLFEINGVTFNWIENKKESVGVIAQDVERVLPQLVKDMGAHKVVNYNGLIGLLVECIKHQQKQIDELKEHMIGS